ncbi:MAG TPA: hypothetical protein VIU61_16800 [Kofleriaceae bacterium]
MVARSLIVLAVACSSKQPAVRADDAAKPAPPRSDAATLDAGSAGSGSAGIATTGIGEVAIRVEWKNVPTAMRASPGKTPCNTPRAPSVTPTTTWGIPEVVVFIPAVLSVSPEARITLADCALSPRLVAGAEFVVESAMDRPAKLVLTKRGTITTLPALVTGDVRNVQLPIAGHAVELPLEADGIYQLATDGKDPELAWLVAGKAAITDASGLATFKVVSRGTHAVTAWLPPRAGQPARFARGTVTVVANELAELTLQLVP